MMGSVREVLQERNSRQPEFLKKNEGMHDGEIWNSRASSSPCSPTIGTKRPFQSVIGTEITLPSKKSRQHLHLVVEAHMERVSSHVVSLGSTVPDDGLEEPPVESLAVSSISKELENYGGHETYPAPLPSFLPLYEDDSELSQKMASMLPPSAVDPVIQPKQQFQEENEVLHPKTAPTVHLALSSPEMPPIARHQLSSLPPRHSSFHRRRSAAQRTDGDLEASPPEGLPSFPPSKSCSNCTTTHTSRWRQGMDNFDLCNACGVYQIRHLKPRPVSLASSIRLPANSFTAKKNMTDAGVQSDESAFSMDQLRRSLEAEQNENIELRSRIIQLNGDLQTQSDLNQQSSREIETTKEALHKVKVKMHASQLMKSVLQRQAARAQAELEQSQKQAEEADSRARDSDTARIQAESRISSLEQEVENLRKVKERFDAVRMLAQSA